MNQSDSQGAGRLLRCGEIVGGHYRVEGVLGEGGMAVVYRARNTATNQECALKVLHAQLGARSEFRELFAKEAKVGAVVGDSPYIVRVFDAGFDPTRRLPFIVMELLSGVTLQQAMLENRFGLKRVVAIMDQLGQALGQAHAAGVIHRDLKPSNIFLAMSDGEQVVKVMDFGIAKVLADEAMRTATQIGTPAYTAPEQMGATTRRLAERQGIRIARGVSPATDVWALGLIAYEMLVGVRPGQYWDVETMTELPMKIAFEPLDLASERAAKMARSLPAGFDLWFGRCLAKDAADRFASAAEAVAALMHCLEDVSLPEDQQATWAMAHDAPRLSFPATVASSPVLPLAASSTVEPLPLVSTPPPFPESEQALTQAMCSTGDYHTGDAVVLPPPIAACGPPTAPLDSAPGLLKSSGRNTRPGKLSVRATWLLVASLFVGMMAILANPRARSAANTQTVCSAESLDDEANRAQCQHDCDAGRVRACLDLARRAAKKGDLASARSSHFYRLKACGVSTKSTATWWQHQTAQSPCEAGKCLAQACMDAAGDLLQKNSDSATGKAIALLERTCQAGETPVVLGCVKLGRLRRKAGNVAAARKSFGRACDAGQMKGCVALADDLAASSERAIAGTDRKARGLYRRACDKNELEGCRGLAGFAAAGRGGWARDPSLAKRLRQRACRGGVSAACVALGVDFRDGSANTEIDSLKAERLLRTACQDGELAGCAELATLLMSLRASRPGAAEKAYAYNKRACDGGSAQGCVQLASMVQRGAAGLRSDLQREKMLLEKACALQAETGCAPLLSLMSRHRLRASKLWVAEQVAGCEKGSSFRCFMLASLRATGELVDKDPAASARSFARACDRGHARSCTALANVYFAGAEGVAAQPERSYRLNQRACKQGDEVGCSRLALLLATGQGTTKDLQRARRLHQRACSRAQARVASRLPRGTAENSPLKLGVATAQKQRCDALASLLGSETGAPHSAKEPTGN